MKNTSKKPIIFIHVPRCGGTTLNGILQNYFPNEKQYQFTVGDDGTHKDQFEKFLSMPQTEKNRFRYIAGHINFGLHQEISEPCEYFTFFRKPAGRIISYYNKVLSDKSHFLHGIIMKERMTLEDLLKSQFSTEFSNAQVRQMTGEMGKCDESTLARAIENLDNNFSVFGLTESYDESLVLFRNQFETPSPYYLLLNKSKSTSKPSVSEELKDLIAKTNGLDIQLYEYAKVKFNALIEKQGPQFAQEVEKFKRRNKTLQKIKIGKNQVGMSVWNYRLNQKGKAL